MVGGPLAAAARSFGAEDAPDTVFMLAVPTLIAADSPARNWGLDLRGLTLGVGGLGDAAPALAALDLPPVRTPVVFVDVGTPRRPGDVWRTPAHEIGHALGLSHRDGGEAVLMRPGVDGQRCRPGISEAEAAAAAARLAPPVPTPGP